VVGGKGKVDNEAIYRMVPLRFNRRQLYRLQILTGGIKRCFGGTISLGLKRGSLVKHPKWGLGYVGGTMDDRISLHDLKSGERICQNAKVEELKVLGYGSWRWN
jgi:hypothetical protein